MTVWPGQMYPLGATPDEGGVNFAVYTEAADRVEVCLFEPDGSEVRHSLPEVTAFVHHGYVPGEARSRRSQPWDVASSPG